MERTHCTIIGYPYEYNTRIKSKNYYQKVVYDCVLYRPATFAWETPEYLQMTPEGIETVSYTHLTLPTIYSV